MTSPIPRDVKAACLRALPGFLAAHGLDPDAPVEQDETGWVNPCYLVGDDLVVRFNSRDPDEPKFARETIAFELVRPLGIPVPEVVIHDATRRHAPHEALVTRRLPGASVESSWPDLDSTTRARLGAAVGDVMATLHDVDPGGFGELASEREERTESLREVAERALEQRLDDARRARILGSEDAARARRVVAARIHALDALARPSLVHGDLHLGNVLHVGGEITGVLDFEWSRAGDPVEDLVSAGFVADLWPEADGPLREAYRARRPESPDERARLDVHRVLHNVLMCTVSRQHFPNEADGTLAATQRHLVSLDAS